MNIDTTRLLLLTGVFTASLGALGMLAGCTIKADAPPAAHVVDGSAPSESPTPPAADKVGTSKPDSAQDSTTKPGTDAGVSHEGGTEAGAAACLDDSAPAAQPVCPTAAAGGECLQACDDFATAYKKGLSADVRKCLTANLCSNDTSSCSNAALAKACADPTATTFCTPLVNGCKGANGADTITQASCEGLAKGLTAAGRATLQSCFEQEAVCGDCLAKMK